MPCRSPVSRGGKLVENLKRVEFACHNKAFNVTLVEGNPG